MIASLVRLLAEASTLAGGEHPCAVLGHKWESIGGRACPFYGDEACGNASQAVFECSTCGEIDYGERGGPGFAQCLREGFNCGGAVPDDERRALEAVMS